MSTYVHHADGRVTCSTTGQSGLPFRLVSDRNFRFENAEFSHTDERSVTFRDDHRNYAKVIAVRNPVAWCRRHGFRL